MDSENVVSKYERLKDVELSQRWIHHINEYLSLLNDIVEAHDNYRVQFYDYMKELDNEFSMRVNKLRYMFDREFDTYIG